MTGIMSIGMAIAMCLGAGPDPGIPDTPFQQEYHKAYPIAAKGPANDVRALAVDRAGTVWAATKAGVRVLQDGAWHSVPGVPEHSAYALHLDAEGTAWAGTMDGLFAIAGGKGSKIPAISSPISVVGAHPDGGLIALGPRGLWHQTGGQWVPFKASMSSNLRDSVTDDGGNLWVATAMGLYRLNEEGTRHYFRSEELISGEVGALATAPDGRLWIGSWGGIDVYENGGRVAHFTGKEGLPNYDVRSLTFDADGRLWAGTALGVARYDGKAWSLRHSRRWLLSDDVRDVAIGPDGTAWIATAAGVSAIKQRQMTLADKAAYYLDICRTRHVRPPGIVEKIRYPNPDDTSKWVPKDDDNDGGYTAVYLVMESMRYAVTQAPDAKANADKAFELLEFLQKVTKTDGFFARTVIPSDWTEMADANHEHTPEEIADKAVRDPRYKPVDIRWRLTDDKKWLWKGDTSSDEVTAHMGGMYFYYDLVADEAYKARVRANMSRIMDYIIDGGYVFRDIDGKSTRWGVWAPEKLLHDPDWRVEAPVNALEILAFLRIAHHVTGNQRYLDEYHRLITEHGYAELARRPKSYGLSERTHIDDELMTMVYPALLKLEDDPELHAIYAEGVTWAYRTVEGDQNPYFNFSYGLAGGKNVHVDESVAFLRDQPLDLRQWTVDNSKREDIDLVRRPMLEPLQTSRMLPPSERGVMRWDKNPWEVISGDFGDPRGSLESSGVFWLLPYWMGRYCGYIEAAEK